MKSDRPDIEHLGAGPRSVEGLLSAAASARSDRTARRSLDLVEGHLAGDDPETTRARLRALRLLGEVASTRVEDPELLGSLLERLASAHLMASGELALLRTDIGVITLEGRLADLVLAVAADLLVVASSAVAGDDGAELHFRAYEDDGWTMLVVETGGEAVDVLPAEGAAALHRVRAAAAVLGGVVRRRCDGGRLGVAFTIETSNRGVGRPAARSADS